MVQPAMAVALALEGALHFPASFGMMMDQTDNVTMVDVPLRNAELAGHPLRRIKLGGDALVVGVQRDGQVLVPHGDTVLRHRDTLVLVGNPRALREARQQPDPERA
ncbi:MAG: TrkA C-terminal domain-containing protein [Spartobacteria bacterium]